MIDRQNIGFYMKDIGAGANHLRVSAVVFDCGAIGR